MAHREGYRELMEVMFLHCTIDLTIIDPSELVTDTH